MQNLGLRCFASINLSVRFPFKKITKHLQWWMEMTLLNIYFCITIRYIFLEIAFQGNVPTLPKATITRKLCVSRTAWRCISLTGPCGDCNLLQCLCCPHEEFHFFYQRNSFILPEKLFHFPLWRRRKVSPLLNPSAAQLTTLLVVCGHYKVVLPVNLLFVKLYGV